MQSFFAIIVQPQVTLKQWMKMDENEVKSVELVEKSAEKSKKKYEIRYNKENKCYAKHYDTRLKSIKPR